MRRSLELAGYLASVALVTIGVIAVVMGVNAFNEVRDNLAKEKIVGTPDSSIAGEKVNTGEKARAFADVMRKHALEASDGRVYSEMGRFLTEDGEETDDPEEAATSPETGRPVDNAARNLWVTETALATALNVAYMAENLAIFAIVVGIALLLTGVGFLVLVRYTRAATDPAPTA